MKTVVTRIVGWIVALVVSLLSGYLCTELHETFTRWYRPGANAMSPFVSYPSNVRLTDVGGHSTVKHDLIVGILYPMKRPDLFYAASHRLTRPPRGFLLHGPPGTGKTMLARALASEANVPLLTLTNAALESKWYGETPKLLDAVFTAARETYAPCIVFIDEIDSLGRTRSEHDVSHVYALKCELLRHLDRLGDSPVAVIACTNCPMQLDPALRRRFERVVPVGLPTEDERHAILNVVMRHETACVDLHALAQETGGFTGADLAAAYAFACSRRLRRVLKRTALETITSPSTFANLVGPFTANDLRAFANYQRLRV